MTVYRIEFKQSAKKELAQLPRPIAEKNTGTYQSPRR